MQFVIIISLLFVSMYSRGQHTTIRDLIPVALNPCTSVKDQYYSSTCWSFAGNSFLESELLRKGVKDIDLSEMYTAHIAWEQKILLHLQYNGMNCLTPGSQFHNIQWVMKNYGLVPEEAYTGKPGGEKNHNHAELDTALTKYITGMVQQKKNAPDITDWINLNAILTANLGKLPFTFVINGKTFTPKTYLQSLPIQPDDYIEITSYNHHPYYQPFVFENKYNYSYDKYMNVPLADFMAITDNALKNGYTVLWNGDVTDKGFNFYEGNAALHNIKDAVAERQRTFADSTSYMDHMMHVAGIYAGSDGHKWYYIKNSWGTGNNLNGYLLMDENYFKIKTAAIVVNKEAIPAAIRQRMKW